MLRTNDFGCAQPQVAYLQQNSYTLGSGNIMEDGAQESTMTAPYTSD